MVELSKMLAETAMRLLRSVQELPQYDDAKRERVKELIADGAKKIQAELYDEAIRCFEEAIRLNPRSLGAHLAMIRGLKCKGSDLEAMSWGGFALALADTGAKRSLVYLLLGSTALDTFKISHSLDHAQQSLGLYYRASHEQPTEYRAVWNAVETHMEILFLHPSDELLRKKHTNEIRKKMGYLSSTFTQTPNHSLASRFVQEGEKILKRSDKTQMSIPEFVSGLNEIRKHAGVLEDDVQSLSHRVDGSDHDSRGLRKKVLAYVLASALLAGSMYFGMDHASGAEGSRGGSVQVEQLDSNSSERERRPPIVFRLGTGNQIETASLDPDWQEIEELATVDPDWDEMKQFA